jgi:hypothetical protein
MNKLAEVNLQGMIIAIAFIVLVTGAFTLMITSSEHSYDTSGYDSETLGFIFSETTNLSTDIQTVTGQVDGVVVDKGVFDFFAGVFNDVTKPFKTVYQYFRAFRSITSSASDMLMFSDIVKDFIIVMFTTLIIIGIVMIGIYLGRDKNR